MAVDSQSLVDDVKNHVVKIDKKFTNTTNESATSVIDVSGLLANIDGDACSAVKITKINAIISGVTVELLWDATTDVSCLKMHTDGTFDFKDFGGITNDSGAGKTGDVLLTTTGAASGDFFTLIIHTEKVY